jgi:hypothetical protein
MIEIDLIKKDLYFGFSKTYGREALVHIFRSPTEEDRGLVRSRVELQELRTPCKSSYRKQYLMVELPVVKRRSPILHQLHISGAF